MHHIYHTEGIILGSKGFGEAGKTYFIFTRDLGMVMASAQGVRKMSSKLRFILQDFAYLKIDLVRGKDFWRVTSASKTNLLEDLTKNPETKKILASISNLLKRLLAGEDPNRELFNDILDGLTYLEKAKPNEELKNIEITLVLQILEKLGYLDKGKAGTSRVETVALINQILRETQL